MNYVNLCFILQNLNLLIFASPFIVFFKILFFIISPKLRHKESVVICQKIMLLVVKCNN